MTVQILKRVAPLAAVLAGLGCGAAWAGEGEPILMPLGAAASAPVGFLEMCERTPTECLSVARPTDAMLSDVRTWAGRARWSAVFQAAGIQSAPAALPASIAAPTVAPAALVAQPAVEQVSATVAHPPKPTAQDVRALKDQRRKHPRAAPAKIPPARVAPMLETVVVEPMRVPSPTLIVADVTVRDLETVTRRFNRAIRRASDAASYGREDVWVLPQGRRASGDCEDYVLAKRRALIDDGVDPAALSIAVVRTRWGELHAVLLVATAEGEQVLDNLTPWVVNWRDAPYEWLERQAPGQPLVWVQAAT